MEAYKNRLLACALLVVASSPTRLEAKGKKSLVGEPFPVEECRFDSRGKKSTVSVWQGDGYFGLEIDDGKAEGKKFLWVDDADWLKVSKHGVEVNRFMGSLAASGEAAIYIVDHLPKELHDSIKNDFVFVDSAKNLRVEQKMVIVPVWEGEQGWNFSGAYEIKGADGKAVLARNWSDLPAFAPTRVTSLEKDRVAIDETTEPVASTEWRRGKDAASIKCVKKGGPGSRSKPQAFLEAKRVGDKSRESPDAKPQVPVVEMMLREVPRSPRGWANVRFGVSCAPNWRSFRERLKPEKISDEERIKARARLAEKLKSRKPTGEERAKLISSLLQVGAKDRDEAQAIIDEAWDAQCVGPYLESYDAVFPGEESAKKTK